MASCSFTLRFDTTQDALFQSARKAVSEQGGVFVGTAQQGQASLPTGAGIVSWTYVTHGQSLEVTVTDKPWIVSCATVQQKMAELVAQAPKPTLDTVGEPIKPPPPPVPASGSTPESIQAAQPLPTAQPNYALWFVASAVITMALATLGRKFKWL